MTDKEVIELIKIPTLEVLMVSKPQLTDAAVAPLAKITSLKTLILTKGALSPSALDQFKRLRPDVDVQER